MSTKQSIIFNVRANGVQQTTRQMNGLNKSMKRAGLSATQLAAGAAVMGGAVLGMGRKVIKAADAYTNLTNQTKVFASSNESAAFKMQSTIDIARKMNSSLNEVGQVYQRISMVQQGVGFSDTTAATIVENLTKAVKLSGATAQEAEGALRQFAQGMAANRLSGQELNSVLEQTPMIAQLLAESLGVATGDLREMGKQGLLTTKVLTDTFGKSIDSLDEKFKKFSFTMEAQFVSVRRELTLMTGQLAKVSGASTSLGKLIKSGLTDNLVKLNGMLSEGGDAAETMSVMFQTVLGGALGVAAVALVGLVTGVIALIGWIPLAVAGLAGLTGALYAYYNANRSSATQVAELNKSIEITQDRLARLTKLGMEDSQRAQDLRDTLAKLTEQRQKHVDVIDAEAKAQEELNEKRKAAAKQTFRDFVSGNVDFDTTALALRTGVSTEGVGKQNVARQNSEQISTLVEDYDDLGNALRQYREQTALLNTHREDLIAKGHDVAAMERAIREEYARAYQNTPEYRQAEEQMQAQLDKTKDEQEKLKDAQDERRKSLEKLNEEMRKGAADQFADTDKALPVAAGVMARGGDPRAQIGLDYAKDRGTMVDGMAGATPDQLALLEEALVLRREQYELDMLEAEHKMAMTELNQGLIDQTLTLGELGAGVGHSMAEGFGKVAQQTMNVSGQISNMTSQMVGGLSNEIAALATTGDGSFKQLGRSFVTMIAQMIVKLVVMMGIIAAISAIPGGSAVLEMMGMGGGAAGGGAGGGVPSAGGSGGVGKIGGMDFSGTKAFGGDAFGGSALNWKPRAGGGPVYGGEPLLVGERGPELFVPPQSGSIKNNTTTQGMMGQQAPQVTVVNVDSTENTLDALGSEEGESIIMNVIQRNPEILRSIG